MADEQKSGWQRAAEQVTAELKRLGALGGYELGGLWTGQVYHGDMGLLTSTPDELQRGNAQGEPPAPEPPAKGPETFEDTLAVHATVLRAQFDGEFIRAAIHHKDQMEKGLYSPEQREAVFDGLLEQGKANREVFESRGMTPPLSSVLNRDELRAVIEPERYRDAPQTEDAGSYAAKGRSLPEEQRSDRSVEKALEAMKERERGR